MCYGSIMGITTAARKYDSDGGLESILGPHFSAAYAYADPDQFRFKPNVDIEADNDDEPATGFARDPQNASPGAVPCTKCYHYDCICKDEDLFPDEVSELAEGPDFSPESEKDLLTRMQELIENGYADQALLLAFLALNNGGVAHDQSLQFDELIKQGLSAISTYSHMSGSEKRNWYMAFPHLLLNDQNHDRHVDYLNVTPEPVLPVSLSGHDVTQEAFDIEAALQNEINRSAQVKSNNPLGGAVGKRRRSFRRETFSPGCFSAGTDEHNRHR